MDQNLEKSCQVRFSFILNSLTFNTYVCIIMYIVTNLKIKY